MSRHLCGVAVAYEEHGGKQKKKLFKDPDDPNGREQGSLLNFQKRKIADATEWIRTHSVYKPRIFVCTTSNKWGHEIYEPQISKFCHNLTNGYGCENYVWVREFNKVGAPHYHFVADIDRIIDPVKLSLYWSSLFTDSPVKNSVRLGTKPDKQGRRKYTLDSSKMAFYMAKYLGKELHQKIFPNSWHSATMHGRSFGISHEAGRQSEPIKYETNFHFEPKAMHVMTATGMQEITMQYCYGRTMENDIGEIFDKTQYTWKKSEKHAVWFGREKKISQSANDSNGSFTRHLTTVGKSSHGCKTKK